MKKSTLKALIREIIEAHKQLNEGIGDWAGWGVETPEQKFSRQRLERLGFVETHHFPENEEDDPEQRMEIVMTKRKGPTQFSCQIGSDGKANGESIEAYVNNFKSRVMREDYGDEYDPDDDRSEFADPHGKSALRASSKSNPRNRPCPTCKRPNMLTPADVAKGYQCDQCADSLEGPGMYEGDLSNTAKAIGAAGLIGMASIGSHYLGKLDKTVNIGNTTYLVVPEDHGTVPYDAKVVKGPDGKIYKVWSAAYGYKTRTPTNFAYKVN